MGLVGDEEGGVDGLHAGRTGEASHEPVVDAVGVVGVHAWQVAHAVADAELDHTNHASEKDNELLIFAHSYCNLWFIKIRYCKRQVSVCLCSFNRVTFKVPKLDSTRVLLIYSSRVRTVQL